MEFIFGILSGFGSGVGMSSGRGCKVGVGYMSQVDAMSRTLSFQPAASLLSSRIPSRFSEGLEQLTPPGEPKTSWAFSDFGPALDKNLYHYFIHEYSEPGVIP